MGFRWNAGLGFSLALLMGTGAAQTVIDADDAELQLQISRDAKGFSRCGIRAVVKLFTTRPMPEVFDFSLNLDADTFHGFAKAGLYRVDLKGIKDGPLTSAQLITKQPAPTKFWVSHADQGYDVLIDKPIPTDDKGFMLGIADPVGTLKAVVGIANGDRMHFALLYPKDRIERVISFSKTLSKNDLDTLDKCITAGVERTKRAHSIKDDDSTN